MLCPDVVPLEEKDGEQKGEAVSILFVMAGGQSPTALHVRFIVFSVVLLAISLTATAVPQWAYDPQNEIDIGLWQLCDGYECFAAHCNFITCYIVRTLSVGASLFAFVALIGSIYMACQGNTSSPSKGSGLFIPGLFALCSWSCAFSVYFFILTPGTVNVGICLVLMIICSVLGAMMTFLSVYGLSYVVKKKENYIPPKRFLASNILCCFGKDVFTANVLLLFLLVLHMSVTLALGTAVNWFTYADHEYQVNAGLWVGYFGEEYEYWEFVADGIKYENEGVKLPFLHTAQVATICSFVLSACGCILVAAFLLLDRAGMVAFKAGVRWVTLSSLFQLVAAVSAIIFASVLTNCDYDYCAITMGTWLWSGLTVVALLLSSVVLLLTRSHALPTEEKNLQRGEDVDQQGDYVELPR